MEEEKAAAYYDELTRKGEGAARFKQGLGFSSASNDAIPSRGSSSSFLNKFVKASSPSKTSDLEKQVQLESIQSKLKKKPEKSRTDSSSRVSKDNDREKVRTNRRSRSRSNDTERRHTRRSRSRDSGRRSRRSTSRDGGSRHSRRRSRSRSRDVGRSSRRRSRDSDRHSRRRSRSKSRDAGRSSRRRRSRSWSRDSDRHSRRRSRSRSKDAGRSSRRRSRSRSRDSDRHSRHRSRSGRSHSRSSSQDDYAARKKRSRSRETERLDRDKKSESSRQKSGKTTKVDYGELIKGYDNMTPAERVKAKMKLQLSETAEKDESKGVGPGWERFNFDKDAPLDDEEIEATEDDSVLVKKIGQSFRYSAVETRKEDELKAAHDEAMFGAPSLSQIYVEREDGKLSPVGNYTSDRENDDATEEEEEDNKKEEENNNPLSNLLSAQALSLKQGSWRDRVRKL